MQVVPAANMPCCAAATAVLPLPLCCRYACRNLLAVCFIICVQQNLSLRSQIVNPLVVIFLVLASTAALVREATVVEEWQQPYAFHSTSSSSSNTNIVEGNKISIHGSTGARRNL
jgi:hypothetical protein